ncbi:hypothetical protein SC171_27185 [Pantoea cypripedii]|uniref:pentapeptide repeat-containing protein n=1 Tax=Pantoea cypripedii TaxID=55209 RepID=UPI002FCB70C1
MSDISVNALTSPMTTSAEDLQPGPLSRPAINNVLVSPSSNTPSAMSSLDADNVAQLEDINDKTFVNYMHNIRPHDQQPRIFRGLGFGYDHQCKPGAFYEPMIFNGDTFFDLNFRGHCTNYRIEMKNCIITADENQLIWYGSNFKNSCWKGATIDGSYKGQQGSIRDCELSQTDMSGCKLKNLHIVNNTSCQIEQIDFSNSEFENITFSNDLKEQYKLKNVSFKDIKAGKLALNNVNCVENVDFTNAKIDKLSLLEGTKLTGAIFSDNAPDLIKLDPEMFYGITQIDRHLNSINNPDTGALFFNTLASINNNTVRCAFAEQLVAMLNGDSVLAEAYRNITTLKLSFMKELSNSCYSGSEIIKDFFDRELLNHSKNAVLSETPNSDISELLLKLKEEELLNYQFPINQLIKADSELRDKFYRQTPISNFVNYIEEQMMIEDADAPHQIFYNPDNKTALYLPAQDFRDLLHASQTPERYAVLCYQPDEEKKVTDVPAAFKVLGSVLEVFPMLHSLWSRSGGIFTPVIRFLFSHAPGLESQQKNKAAEIEKHMISLLMRKVDASTKLTEAADESLLCEILEPFYRTQTDEESNKAQALRWQLIEVAQHRLALGSKKFSDAEQKIIAGMIIIRMLADLFSTRFYAEEEDSANAPRQLARLLIDDLNSFRPGIIHPANANEWKERLMPKSVDDTYTCSAIVAGMVASYKIPGERGAKMNDAIKLHYPLT